MGFRLCGVRCEVWRERRDLSCFHTCIHICANVRALAHAHAHALAHAPPPAQIHGYVSGGAWPDLVERAVFWKVG